VSVWGKSHGTMWGLVWGGVEIVAATLPTRYHTLIGPSLGYSILIGPSLGPHVLEG
jgi:hypothetical protein